jgi:hypothetical protein
MKNIDNFNDTIYIIFELLHDEFFRCKRTYDFTLVYGLYYFWLEVQHEMYPRVDPFCEKFFFCVWPRKGADLWATT